LPTALRVLMQELLCLLWVWTSMWGVWQLFAVRIMDALWSKSLCEDPKFSQAFTIWRKLLKSLEWVSKMQRSSVQLI
jgi:hypothetical protein